MKLAVYSTSRAFEQFLRTHLQTEFEFHLELPAPTNDPEYIHLLHISGMEADCYGWLRQFVYAKPIKVGVCADLPAIREMLECVRLGAKAYCNSHMAAVHYNQMMQLLDNGQSWFPPKMLAETFTLAQQAVEPVQAPDSLDSLTPREREIALAVGEGNSNREIAAQLDISEPTVKTHLSNIFKKLDVKDRVSLVLYLKPR